ncbi:hypothetical protein CEXT_523511 [Caerostris extrusa]|uniref:Uncharacterized protein n=1 Tax=Caerostris extrusa TaxID=172846 RepID=A0AAV4MGK4_CAEEX|nr:hypothetical protein CEXT_523511 [Caerostris extrusa]
MELPSHFEISKHEWMRLMSWIRGDSAVDKDSSPAVSQTLAHPRVRFSHSGIHYYKRILNLPHLCRNFGKAFQQREVFLCVHRNFAHNNLLLWCDLLSWMNGAPVSLRDIQA